MIEQKTNEQSNQAQKVHQVLKSSGLLWVASEMGKLEGHLENYLAEVKWQSRKETRDIDHLAESIISSGHHQPAFVYEEPPNIPPQETIPPPILVEDIHSPQGVSSQVFLMPQPRFSEVPTQQTSYSNPSDTIVEQTIDRQTLTKIPRTRRKTLSFRTEAQKRRRIRRHQLPIENAIANNPPNIEVITMPPQATNNNHTPESQNPLTLITIENHVPTEDLTNNPPTYAQELNWKKQAIGYLTSDKAQDLYLGIAIGGLTRFAVYGELTHSNLEGAVIAMFAGAAAGAVRSGFLEYLRQNVPERGIKNYWRFIKDSVRYHPKRLASLPNKKELFHDALIGAGIGFVGGAIGYEIYEIVGPLLHNAGVWIGDQFHHITQQAPKIPPTAIPHINLTPPEATHTPPTPTHAPTATPVPTQTPHPSPTPQHAAPPPEANASHPGSATSPTSPHNTPTPTGAETSPASAASLHLAHPENSLSLHPGQTPGQVVDHYISTQSGVTLTPAQEDRAVNIFLASNGGLDAHHVPANIPLNTQALNDYLLQIKASETLSSASERLAYLPHQIYLAHGSTIGDEIYQRTSLVLGHPPTHAESYHLVQDVLRQNHINSQGYNVYNPNWTTWDTSMKPGDIIQLGDQFDQEIQNIASADAA